jgi:GntR family histidine utilization transcriptional repressor
MIPLHQQIRAEIERKILSGAWPPGHRIPFEHEFMAQYGCARMTVSKALSALAEAGLIVRRRRAGSFVAHPRLHSMVLDIPDIQSEIAARGEAYAFRLLRRQVRRARADREDEAALAAGGELLILRGLHVAAGRPFGLEDRLINISAAPQAADVAFEEVSPGAWLLQHVAWTEAENRISAVPADPRTAHLLEIPSGGACLAVERRTWRGAERITQVRQVFPGEAYDLVARFGPQGQS